MPADARLAVDHGFDGILVSNHGGRSTETGRATIEALPEVAAEVGGRVLVFVDGGVRRGTDVFKALALGAKAVGIGRPFLRGLGAFGQAGVDRVLEILQGELKLAMGNRGRRTVADITRAYVATSDWRGWWLVAGGWWLVAGGWWLVAGGWWLVKRKIMKTLTRKLALSAATLGVAWLAGTHLLATREQGRGAAQPAAARPADLVLRGGKIVTVDDRRPEAQAIAVNGDTITALGSNQDIQPYIGSATRVIDLNGALATPGFIDAHVHFTGVGDAARNLKLSTAKDWNDIVRMVAEAAQKARPGEWILGRGWHQEKWSETPSPNVEGFPLHEALSRVSPNNPVWLTHASGHAGFANAYAMKMAEVTKATPDPSGGKILRDTDGNATGLFNERAQGLVGDALAHDRSTRSAARIEADLREVIELAARESLAKGLTTVTDAGSPPSTIDIMKKVVDEQKLPLRVWMMLRETPDRLAVDMPTYRTVNYGDRRFNVRGLKRAIDGALGSRGAWMLEPYADLATTSGMNTDTLDDIRQTAELAIKYDYQVMVHAIGDRGNRETLNIYEQTFRNHPEKNGKALRWRIEHAQHISAADIPRFGQLGVIASMEGIHCTSDAPYVLARLGPTRAEEGAYVWQKLMRSGAIIANGTDAPVEDIDPIPNFYASVSRKLKDGTIFFPDQRMSRMEALRSYTINAAYGGFEEGIKGSLAIGKLADITVFSRDLMTIPEDQIPSARVIYTIVGGKVEYAGR